MKILSLLLIIFWQISAQSADTIPSVQWKPLPDAVKYHIEIQKNGKQILNKLLPPNATHWKGRLSPGLYGYRIRGVDKINRPGDWSDFYALSVAPASPKKKTPTEDQIFKNHPINEPISFEWSEVADITKYRVAVYDAKNNLSHTEDTDATELSVSNLLTGKYSWNVVSVIPATGPLPIGAKQLEVTSSTDSPWSFELGKLTIEKPVDLVPTGRVEIVTGKNVDFTWSPSIGAQAYELTLLEVKNRNLASKAKPKTLVVKSNAISIPLRVGSQYIWKVRALAKESGTQRTLSSMPSASEILTTLPYSPPEKNFWAALGFNPFSYQLTFSGGVSAIGAPTASALNIEAQFRIASMLRGGILLGSQIFNIEGNIYNRNRGAIFAAAVVDVGSLSLGLKVVPSLGLRMHDFFYASRFNDVTTVTQFGLLGPQLKLGFEKTITKNLTLSVAGEMFTPLGLLGLPNATMNSPALLGNYTLEVGLSLALGATWGVSAGYMRGQQSISVANGGTAISNILFQGANLKITAAF